MIKMVLISMIELNQYINFKCHYDKRILEPSCNVFCFWLGGCRFESYLTLANPVLFGLQLYIQYTYIIYCIVTGHSRQYGSWIRGGAKAFGCDPLGEAWYAIFLRWASLKSQTFPSNTKRISITVWKVSL